MKRSRKFDPAAIPVDEWGLYIKARNHDWYLDKRAPLKDYVWVKTKCPRCQSDLEKLQTFLQTSPPRLTSEYILCSNCQFEELRREG